jgi:hypothetical protein
MPGPLDRAGRLLHQALAAEGLGAEHQVERCRRGPVQAQAVVAPVAAEEAAVQQRPLDEVVGVRVLLVQVADLRGEATGAQPAARRRGGWSRARLLRCPFRACPRAWRRWRSSARLNSDPSGPLAVRSLWPSCRPWSRAPSSSARVVCATSSTAPNCHLVGNDSACAIKADTGHEPGPQRAAAVPRDTRSPTPRGPPCQTRPSTRPCTAPCTSRC